MTDPSIFVETMPAELSASIATTPDPLGTIRDLFDEPRFVHYPNGDRVTFATPPLF
ncbi:hypothetical protein SEA_CARON_53 [Microbacterium phage Caron]|uniref:Uncharacterized protein n=1 Tax=Microbacterium phage Caron TaxID=3028494 RepID=A0AAE9ZMJ7_9CAUD|nr:hypothetical protein SEA_CARON_53 [Microbacterium phage Caron]